MWMGGLVPLGYDVRDRHLVVNQTEAVTVREIFRRYQELGSVRLEELDRRGIQSKARISQTTGPIKVRLTREGPEKLREPAYPAGLSRTGDCRGDSRGQSSARPYRAGINSPPG
jgi:hypothetical protein